MQNIDDYLLSIHRGVCNRVSQRRILRLCLSLGIWAGLIFVVGTLGLALLIPGYSQLRQTVSEIGEMGSPARLPFALMLCTISVCLIVFGLALKCIAHQASLSTLPAYLLGCMAISAAGVGVFASPHPLHNLFGLSELVGYQAPLATALTWRCAPIRRFSWIIYGLLILAMTANLSVLDTQSTMWRIERPVYGAVQRSLFVIWFVWSAGVAWILRRRIGSQELALGNHHSEPLSDS